jgi:hypothetical protein
VGWQLDFFTQGNRSSVAKMHHCLLYSTCAVAVVECTAKKLEVTFQNYSMKRSYREMGKRVLMHCICLIMGVHQLTDNISILLLSAISNHI